MSQLILPAPVVLVSQSFDVDASGVGAITSTGDGTMNTVSPLIPARSLVKDCSLNVEVMAFADAAASGNMTLQMNLVFTDVDGLSNAVNLTSQVLVCQAANPNPSQVVSMRMSVHFGQGATGAAGALHGIGLYEAVSTDNAGGARTSITSGTWNDGGLFSPMLRTNLDRRLNVQVLRTVSGASNRLNIRAVRVIGYGLNMQNWI